ncbi:MAG TPA: hypothetical protein VMU07_03985 [Candidatus Paceibacterota bacterium]|nr:hypothetical protein [Candidatus Paceibacterota bacterium]
MKEQLHFNFEGENDNSPEAIQKAVEQFQAKQAKRESVTTVEEMIAYLRENDPATVERVGEDGLHDYANALLWKWQESSKKGSQTESQPFEDVPPEMVDDHVKRYKNER